MTDDPPLLTWDTVALAIAGFATVIYFLTPSIPKTITDILIILFIWIVLLLYLDYKYS